MRRAYADRLAYLQKAEKAETVAAEAEATANGEPASQAEEPAVAS